MTSWKRFLNDPGLCPVMSLLSWTFCCISMLVHHSWGRFWIWIQMLFYLGIGRGVGLLFGGHYSLVFLFFFCPVVGLQLSLEKLKIIGAASFLTSSCRSFKEGPNKTPYHNMLFKAVFSNMLCTITQILQGQKAIFR